MTDPMQGSPEEERVRAHKIARRFARDADFYGNADMRKAAVAIACHIAGGLDMSKMRIVAIGTKEVPPPPLDRMES